MPIYILELCLNRRFDTLCGTNAEPVAKALCPMAQRVFGEAVRCRKLRPPIDAFSSGAHIVGHDKVPLFRRNFAKTALKTRVARFILLRGL